MAKKDQTISILTVGQLAKLFPPNTKIYFKDLGTDQQPAYVPACEEEITWAVGDGKIFLNVGEDDGQ